MNKAFNLVLKALPEYKSFWIKLPSLGISQVEHIMLYLDVTDFYWGVKFVLDGYHFFSLFYCRDTAKYHPLMKTNLVCHSLKYLTQKYLGQVLLSYFIVNDLEFSFLKIHLGLFIYLFIFYFMVYLKKLGHNTLFCTSRISIVLVMLSWYLQTCTIKLKLISLKEVLKSLYILVT